MRPRSAIGRALGGVGGLAAGARRRRARREPRVLLYDERWQPRAIELDGPHGQAVVAAAEALAAAARSVDPG